VAEPRYHVILGDRQVGPYDRRTIVGMRIKNALSSLDVLVDEVGARLTVSDLLRPQARGGDFNPNRSGSFSLVQATYSASLLAVEGPGPSIPKFRGEIEARIQTDVLRLAGRFREFLAWKEDRVKLPLSEIAHARVRNSIVDLWLRPDDRQQPQRLTLELFTPESAGEFVEWLPAATPWPEADSAPTPMRDASPSHRGAWIAIAATAVVLVVVMTVLLSRRLY
jgi:hypothetical protein